MLNDKREKVIYLNYILFPIGTNKYTKYTKCINNININVNINKRFLFLYHKN